MRQKCIGRWSSHHQMVVNGIGIWCPVIDIITAWYWPSVTATEYLPPGGGVPSKSPGNGSEFPKRPSPPRVLVWPGVTMPRHCTHHPRPRHPPPTLGLGQGAGACRRAALACLGRVKVLGTGHNVWCVGHFPGSPGLRPINGALAVVVTPNQVSPPGTNWSAQSHCPHTAWGNFGVSWSGRPGRSSVVPSPQSDHRLTTGLPEIGHFQIPASNNVRINHIYTPYPNCSPRTPPLIIHHTTVQWVQSMGALGVNWAWEIFPLATNTCNLLVHGIWHCPR